jgi:beta-glucanase (GH16 family)
MKTRVRFAVLLAALLLASPLTACDPERDDPGGTADACSACVYHELVWSDEFDGSGPLDPASWSYHVGAGWNAGAGMFLGWGNWEAEWYRPEQAIRRDGVLVITADHDEARAPIAGWDSKIRSARVVTQGKRSWSRARVEARIAMPSVPGTWPAFWLMGDGYDGTATSERDAALDHYDRMASTWPACGEIDIMEHKNQDTYTIHNVFWDTRTELLPWDAGTIDDDASSYPSPLATRQLDPTQYHVYALEWTDAHMFWYVDGVLVKNESISAANQEELNGADRKFFVLLNLAIGSAGTPFTGGPTPAVSDFPLEMHVDYVRVYQ